jgi:RNA polymerase sigma-70 factor (ECF subfamily)
MSELARRCGLKTDGELVRQVLEGERTACDDLVRRWSARILAFCHSRVGNHHAAEDLAQESLLRGLRGLRTLQSPEQFGTWLCGIAVRVCRDWRKAKQSSQVPFTVLESNGKSVEIATTAPDTAEAGVDQRDDERRLLQEVESLSEQHREIIMLYYYQDVTYRELAEMLGVSTATVNARLTQARAILRERLLATRR